MDNKTPKPDEPQTAQGGLPSPAGTEGKLKNDKAIGKKWWDFTKSPDFTNPAISIATIVIAIATVFTYMEIHGGSIQTDKLVAAAERIAAASENAIGQSVESLRLDQRAWLNIKSIGIDRPTPGNPVGIAVNMTNTGKTVARHVVFLTVLQETKGPIGAFEIEGAPHKFAVAFPNANYSSIGTGKRLLTKDDIEEIKSGKQRIYIFGRITYDDVFGKSHFTQFCGIYSYQVNAMDSCAEPYADAD
jgi:hypothetical protein